MYFYPILAFTSTSYVFSVLFNFIITTAVAYILKWDIPSLCAVLLGKHTPPLFPPANTTLKSLVSEKNAETWFCRVMAALHACSITPNLCTYFTSVGQVFLLETVALQTTVIHRGVDRPFSRYVWGELAIRSDSARHWYSASGMCFKSLSLPVLKGTGCPLYHQQL